MNAYFRPPQTKIITKASIRKGQEQQHYLPGQTNIRIPFSEVNWAWIMASSLSNLILSPTDEWRNNLITCHFVMDELIKWAKSHQVTHDMCVRCVTCHHLSKNIEAICPSMNHRMNETKEIRLVNEMIGSNSDWCRDVWFQWSLFSLMRATLELQIATDFSVYFLTFSDDSK